MNILIPAAGSSMFFKEYFFPKPLIEINGSTMLEMVVTNLSQIKGNKIIFVFGKEECNKFHLDDSVKILTEKTGKVIRLKNATAGALCSCLMAVEYINNDAPLIISNADQIFNLDINLAIEYFKEKKASAGVVTFESIHPRWSYVQMEGEEVVEVAEKRPLSNHAIAGIYYYEHGSDFVEAAKRAILKECSIENKYYISSTLNELILMNKKVVSYEIDKSQYHSFYSPEKIKEYERLYRR